MKKILITGGAGFIGSNLAKALIAKGYEIRILDNFSKQIHGDDYKISLTYNELLESTEILHANIMDGHAISKAIQGVDVIVHFAAETGTGQSMYEIQQYVSVNSTGTAILLESILNTKNTVQKIVVASSRAVYGEGKYICEEHGVIYPNQRRDQDLKNHEYEPKCTICGKPLTSVPTDEESRLLPHSIYGVTKLNQEQLIMTTGKSIGLPVVALRYQNVYGPNQSLKNPYTGILSIFSNLIRNNKTISVFEDGKESRDFVYINDVIDATILAIEKNEANYDIFNVGYGKSISVLEVTKKICSLFNVENYYSISHNYRQGDIRHNTADITKISAKLGYQPKYSFDEGINNFIAWVNTQDVYDIAFEKSIAELKQKNLFK